MLDVLAVIAGGALLVLYVRLGRSIPTGPAEFVYWPPLEPLPYAPLRGFTWEQLHRILARWAALAPALLALSWPARRLFPGRPPSIRATRIVTASASVLAVAGATVLLFGMLTDRVLVDDDLTYRFQAELLASGRIAEDTVPPWAPEPFTIETPIGFTGKYLFGEPLVQTVGLRLGGPPALIHLPFLTLTLICWFELMRRESGTSVALWSTAALAISPMVVLNTATGGTQPTSLLCAAAGGLGLSWLRGLPKSETSEAGSAGSGSRGEPTLRELWLGALLLGGSVGFLATVRPQVALPVGGVLGLWGALSLLRRRRFGQLLLLAGTTGCFVLAIALYDLAVTGSPWRLPWSLYFPSEHYGFGLISPELADYRHTPFKALQNLLVAGVRIDQWWLGWPSSLLLPLVAWLALGRPSRGAAVWGVAGGALIAFNVGYYSPGVSDTGPIYYHELALLLAALAGVTIAAGFRRVPKLTAAVLLVHVVLGTGTFWLENVNRLHRFVTLVHEPAEEILAAIEPPALLLYETSPQESISLGWLLGGFPKRYREEEAPIVTYPRGNGGSQAALRQRYADRECWYYRVEPRTLRRQLDRCEEVEELLRRPARIEGPPLMLQPTALSKGDLVLVEPGSPPRDPQPSIPP
ncbi:MAG TPA: hypothetical protein VMT85_21160 [Thermoanaerobaculia bacterium]|nr:hypothetical protein [Thermoanaerobaculia bacterium]